VFATSHTQRMALLAAQPCKYATEAYGINDLGIVLTRTFAQVQADRLTIWTALAAAGCLVYADTNAPYTTSTDGWATVGNQTHGLSSTQEGYRVSLNQWVRAGAPLSPTAFTPVAVTANALFAGQPGHPLAGVFDTDTLVSSAQDSGLWNAPNYTADGLHPAYVAMIIMQKAVPTWLMQ
jgi:hypothetical protein